ncbi:hypothetical protein Tco_0559318, partial [Tanacetum coccineum]
EYGVSTSIRYAVSNFLSNTAYLSHQINTAYPLLFDTTYRSSGTEANSKFSVIDFHAKIFYLSSEQILLIVYPLFQTLSLDELRSPDFNLLFDQEYLEEEEEEATAETMEQYMSKTRTDYGSGVARPKIDNKDQFELKGQFLKELGENTWVDVPTNDIFLTQERGAIIPTKLLQMPKYNPSKKWLNTLKNGTIEHLEEEVRIDKVYAAQVRCEQCKGSYYTKDCPQKEEGKTLEEAYYTQFGGPFQGGGYRATTPRHEENSNLIKEIRALIDAAIRNQEPSIKTVGEISNRANEQGASVSVMPLLTYLNLGLGELAHTRLRVELVNRTVKYPKGIAENCPPLEGGESLSPLILRRPFLSTARAKIDVSKKDYFKILEDMDAYRDDGMGDVIFGEPFLREVGIKTKWFEGIITLYNGDDEVTYQIVRSHPRFKNHTNKQCNKIPPLLKESEKAVKNRISHAYQKLKGLYKGVLNLGPDYIRDAKMEEWLTRRHISVHEME